MEKGIFNKYLIIIYKITAYILLIISYYATNLQHYKRYKRFKEWQQLC